MFQVDKPLLQYSQASFLTNRQESRQDRVPPEKAPRIPVDWTLKTLVPLVHQTEAVHETMMPE